MPSVLHLPCSYLPWIVGGKEIYTHHLARRLNQHGWTNHISFHENDQLLPPQGRYEFEGIPVSVLPAIKKENYIIGFSHRTKLIPGFVELLQSIKPDIVHFHDFSWAVNLDHLDAARSNGAKCVMTFHSPGQACQQRELLFAGKWPCDGELRINRCTECRLQEKGLPDWLAKPLSRISLPLSVTGSNPLIRGLTARQMTKLAIGAWEEMISKIDCLHVQAQWIAAMMERNRVPPEKLAFFRSGLPGELPLRQPRRTRSAHEPLKVIMLGRCEEYKGQHLLIEAVQELPRDRPIEVSFFGPYWESHDYGRRCLQKIDGDARFHQPVQVKPSEVTARLAASDVLAVPSTWLETGPLVVLEAFAQRVPVLGSNRGGIAELVQHDQTGWLFPAGDVAALRDLLLRLIQEPLLVKQSSENIKPPRTMEETAKDTASWYEKLLQRR